MCNTVRNERFDRRHDHVERHVVFKTGDMLETTLFDCTEYQDISSLTVCCQPI